MFLYVNIVEPIYAFYMYFPNCLCWKMNIDYLNNSYSQIFIQLDLTKVASALY